MIAITSEFPVRNKATADNSFFFDSLLPNIARVSNVIFCLCLAVISSCYTAASLGWIVSISLILITVANEAIDMFVQTNPRVEGASKLPKIVSNMNLQKRPIMSFIAAALLIIMGVWNQAVRFFMFGSNFLLNQSFFTVSALQAVYGAAALAVTSVLFCLCNFVLNFRKFWLNEIVKTSSIRSDLEDQNQVETEKQTPAAPSNSMLARIFAPVQSFFVSMGQSIKGFYIRSLNQNTAWFDRLVGLSMLCGSVLYFIADYTNLVNLSVAFAASSVSFHPAIQFMFGWLVRRDLLPYRIMPAALLHGSIAWLNQMVLWGFNNKKFHASNLSDKERSGKTKELGWISLFHLGPNTRRITLYGRELICCLVDIVNSMIVVPLIGFQLGVLSLIATMLCRWIVYYFQSREENIDAYLGENQKKVEDFITGKELNKSPTIKPHCKEGCGCESGDLAPSMP